MTTNYCDYVNRCNVAYDYLAQEGCTFRKHQSIDKFVKCPYLTEDGKCNSSEAQKDAQARLVNSNLHDAKGCCDE